MTEQVVRGHGRDQACCQGDRRPGCGRPGRGRGRRGCRDRVVETADGSETEVVETERRRGGRAADVDEAETVEETSQRPLRLLPRTTPRRDHARPSSPLGPRSIRTRRARRCSRPVGSVIRLRLDIAYDGAALLRLGTSAGPALGPGPAEAALEPPASRGRIPVRVAWPGEPMPACTPCGQVGHLDVPAAAWVASSGGRGRAAIAPVDPPDAAADPSRSSAGVERRASPGPARSEVAVAPADFDARWSASGADTPIAWATTPSVRRRGPVVSAVASPGAGWEAMDAAAAPFVGEHDFAAFCQRATAARACGRSTTSAGRVGRSAGATSPVIHRPGGRLLPLDGEVARRGVHRRG